MSLSRAATFTDISESVELCYASGHGAPVKPRATQTETLRQVFERGVALGKDPLRRAVSSASGITTGQRSPWLGQVCPRCGHTFRRGDRVEIAATIQHALDVGCPGKPSREAQGLTEREAFYEGIASAYPPPADLEIQRLLPGNPLLGEANQGPLRRPTCVVCGHSLRPFDEVVVCPCQPGAPLCRGAVHRDSTRALYCWDEWSRSKLSRHCPVTSRKIT